MIRLNVHRESWQFVELMERWNWTRDTDMRRLIVSGEIAPYATFYRELHPVSMAEGAPVVDGETRTPVQADLWLVQRLALKVDTFDYYYKFLSDRPDGDTSAGAQLWALPEHIDLATVLLTFVVSDANRLAVEAAREARNASAKSETINDRLLATFALDRFNWRAGRDLDFTGLTELLDGGKAYGIPVSFNSAKKHIREAVIRANPTDLSNGAAVNDSAVPSC